MPNNEHESDKNESEIRTAEKKYVLLEAQRKIIIRLLIMFWLIAIVFLILRAFFEVVGADPKSLFAGFVYAVSDFIMLPFFGIFPNYPDTIKPGKISFDGPALIAIVSYSMLIFLALIVFYILTRIIKTENQVKETKTKQKIINPSEAESKVL